MTKRTKKADANDVETAEMKNVATGKSNRGGRPRRFNARMKRQYVQLLRSGYNMAQCDRYFGVAQSTSINERHKDASFDRQVTEAYEEGRRAASRRIVDGALQHAEAILTNSLSKDSKGNVESSLDTVDIYRLGALGIKLEKGVEDKLSIEHSGEVTTKTVVDITKLSDEALEELLNATKSKEGSEDKDG